ncbi:Hypothetical protein Ccan_03770 [Capnocytophaga canimorsus Cc5]|uniref:Uncharacterized protein n=1 Tax=Capnocytophaga canimorsus (strain 5) TaxID=860228 RepID=F9YRM0_CAPCC|nr:Hypothetical protein Ccan_03770 [Capnocytophaga canimorsus Cc5]
MFYNQKFTKANIFFRRTLPLLCCINSLFILYLRGALNAEILFIQLKISNKK